MEVRDAAGSSVAGMERGTTDCPAAASVMEFSFEMGQTYTLNMGPSTEAAFTLAIHVAGVSHAHGEHGHGQENHGENDGEHGAAHESGDHAETTDGEPEEDHVSHDH